MLSKTDKDKINDTVANLQDVCAGLWDTAFAICQDKPEAAEAVREQCSRIQVQVRWLREMGEKK